MASCSLEGSQIPNNLEEEGPEKERRYQHWYNNQNVRWLLACYLFIYLFCYFMLTNSINKYWIILVAIGQKYPDIVILKIYAREPTALSHDTVKGRKHECLRFLVVNERERGKLCLRKCVSCSIMQNHFHIFLLNQLYYEKRKLSYFKKSSLAPDSCRVSSCVQYNRLQ